MHDVMKGIRVLEVAQFTFVPAAGAVLARWRLKLALGIQWPRTALEHQIGAFAATQSAFWSGISGHELQPTSKRGAFSVADTHYGGSA